MACLEVFGSCVESTCWTSPSGYVACRACIGERTVVDFGMAGDYQVSNWNLTVL
jgi:hypothetical protein